MAVRPVTRWGFRELQGQPATRWEGRQGCHLWLRVRGTSTEALYPLLARPPWQGTRILFLCPWLALPHMVGFLRWEVVSSFISAEYQSGCQHLLNYL